MADDTDTTRPGEAEAVEKGLEVLGPWPRSIDRQVARATMELVIAAAYPVIAAAVREQVAQEIREEPCGACEGTRSDCDDMADRIARGGR